MKAAPDWRMTDWVVGVDLGGTNLRAAEINRPGQIRRTRHEPILSSPHPSDPFGQVKAMIRDLIEQRPNELPVGIGMGVTGPIDAISGVISNPFTLPLGMQGNVSAVLRHEFGIPVTVENDANAAALGEALHGAGRGAEVVLCITVGTGIGVGVVASGDIYRGACGTHPEAGHLVIDPSGPLCYCGARGCIESLASGTAVLREAVAMGLVDPGGSTKVVHEAAASGKKEAQVIVARAQKALAMGVRALVSAYAPDMVVIVGKARGNEDQLIARVQREIDSDPFGTESVRVRSGQLGDWAGCIGAASLVIRS